MDAKLGNGMVDFEFAYCGLIEAAKQNLELQGKDFYSAFIEWAKANDKITPVVEQH